jgi:hypothetical protein
MFIYLFIYLFIYFFFLFSSSVATVHLLSRSTCHTGCMLAQDTCCRWTPVCLFHAVPRIMMALLGEGPGRDSNPGPLHQQPGALSIELTRPHIVVVKFSITSCPLPSQLALHRRAALSSNSNGTRSVFSRKNPKSSLYCEVSMCLSLIAMFIP